MPNGAKVSVIGNEMFQNNTGIVVDKIDDLYKIRFDGGDILFYETELQRVR